MTFCTHYHLDMRHVARIHSTLKCIETPNMNSRFGFNNYDSKCTDTTHLTLRRTVIQSISVPFWDGFGYSEIPLFAFVTGSTYVLEHLLEETILQLEILVYN